MPAAGATVNDLTQITVTFSEPVMGVKAGDMKVNGVGANGVTGSGDTYTFAFGQPPYGLVFVTWASDLAITDTEDPPVPFAPSAPGSTWNYTLLDHTPPTVATQDPSTNGVVTVFDHVTVTFTETVRGVDASDLLINGMAATNVSGDGATYTFAFPPPNASVAVVSWAPGHGIYDQALPVNNPFDATGPGATWTYQIVDSIPPALVNVNPAPEATLRNLTRILMTFNERVAGLDAADLLLNGVPASSVSNEGVEYTFLFEQPEPGLVQVSWADPLDIYDLASPPNPFAGEGWTYLLDTNLPLPLVTRGPYLQSGTPTGGIVRWRTSESSDGVVLYGTDLDSLTNRAVQNEITTEHIVQVSGLQPDTQYYYAIGSSDYTLAGGAKAGSNYWFNTSPVPGTRRHIRVWALGDSGTAGYGASGEVNQANVREAYYRFAATNGPADIWMMLGDNAYPAGTDQQHQIALFDMYPSTLRNLFLWPTIGNHETDQSFTATSFPYLDIFSLPQNGEAGGIASGTEKYYSFDYGNVHFVCLDSMTSTRSATSSMAEWLESDLSATMQDWVVVFFHHPPYTKGSHDSDRETELIELRENIVPILESYGVDLVLSGHSHCLERSYLLNGHYGLSSTLTEAMKIDGGSGREEDSGAYHKNDQGQGVVYMVGGSSGQITGGPLNHPAHFISLNQLGSILLDVNGGRLDVKFLGINSTFLDHYTLLKSVVDGPDAPEIEPPFLTGNGTSLSFIVQSVPGVNHIVEYKDDLTEQTPWQNWTNLTFAAGSQTITVPLDPKHPARFYRIRVSSQ